jgi:hypothetical protein
LRCCLGRGEREEGGWTGERTCLEESAE